MTDVEENSTQLDGETKSSRPQNQRMQVCYCYLNFENDAKYQNNILIS